MAEAPAAGVFRTTLDQLKRLIVAPPPRPPVHGLLLSGGGARAAYQAGVLQYVAEACPGTYFPILTGVSAGSINAAGIATHAGTFGEAVAALAASWRELTVDHVFVAESSFSFFWNILRRGGARSPEEQLHALSTQHGLVDTAPLRQFLRARLNAPDGRLAGVARNLAGGRLRALAVLGTNYMTGQTTVWVEGKNIKAWERPNRVSHQVPLDVEHIMASTSLPGIFPAVHVGNAWYGDGGIRLSAPLSPAIHLGADHLLIISTRYDRSRREADEPNIVGYPPAAQILGILMNAVFLDVLDQDVERLRRLNDLLEELPPRRRQGMKPLRMMLIRPSQDLGRLAGEYDLKLTGVLRLLARGLGSDSTKSPDWLSMLLFDPEYVARLMEIGYEDARRQHDELVAFLADARDPTLAAQAA